MDYNKIYAQSKGLSLLFAEDSKPLREEMLDILEDFFENVVVAINGKEALSIYRKSTENCPFDLILSDIQMPLMNGVTLSKKIRDINPEQKIIILSAHSENKHLLELINIGISKFIEKPLKQDEFYTTLYQVCRDINKTKVKQSSEPTIMNLGEGYTWIALTGILKNKEMVVELTRYERYLLQYFLFRERQVIKSDEIMSNFLEKGIDITEENIRKLVFKLRKKVPDNCIRSVYGLGYKFDCFSSRVEKIQ